MIEPLRPPGPDLLDYMLMITIWFCAVSLLIRHVRIRIFVMIVGLLIFGYYFNQ